MNFRPVERRIDDLLGRLSVEEKLRLMVERGAPIPRLGIPAFPWWNEAVTTALETRRYLRALGQAW